MANDRNELGLDTGFYEDPLSEGEEFEVEVELGSSQQRSSVSPQARSGEQQTGSDALVASSREIHEVESNTGGRERRAEHKEGDAGPYIGRLGRPRRSARELGARDKISADRKIISAVREIGRARDRSARDDEIGGDLPRKRPHQPTALDIERGWLQDKYRTGLTRVREIALLEEAAAARQAGISSDRIRRELEERTDDSRRTPLRADEEKVPAMHENDAGEERRVIRPRKASTKQQGADHEFDALEDIGEDVLAELDRMDAVLQKFSGENHADVLIGERTPSGEATWFHTHGQFNELYGHVATHMELDERPVLIKSAEGNYEPKPNVYRRNVKDFSEMMEGLSLSDNAFQHQNYFGKAVPGNDTYKTPGGARKREINYQHPLQAGEQNPDLMVRLSNGQFLAIYPKLHNNMKNKALDDVVAEHGKDNVWLKTSGNSYLTPDQYNKRVKDDHAAEKAYAKFCGQAYTSDLDKRPLVVVRRPDKSYVSKDAYDGEVQLPGSKLETNPAKLDILIRAPNGFGYLQPKTLKWLDKQQGTNHFKNIMQEEGLPESLGNRRNKEAPTVMVRESDGVFVPAEYYGDRRVPVTTPNDDIFVQKRDKHGNQSGNFAHLPPYQNSPAANFTSKEKLQLGIEGGSNRRADPAKLSRPEGSLKAHSPKAARADAMDTSPNELPASSSAAARRGLQERPRADARLSL